MRNLKIAISTVNREYGEALARGLLNQSPNLDIALISRDKLLTESDAWKKHIVIVDSQVENKEENVFILDKSLKVSQVYTQLLEKVCQVEGEVFMPSRRDDAKVIGFFSREGGCGATSAAITLGRMLCSKYGKKSIYLSLKASDRYGVYSEADFSCTKSKKEFMLFLERKLPIDINVYTSRDKYGQLYFKEETINSFFEESPKTFKSILSRLTTDYNYDFVILDADESRLDKDNFFCTEGFHVINAGDSRTMNIIGSNLEGTLIINRASENSSEEKAFSIIEDKESFINKGDSVVIAMEKSFAIGIKNIAEYLSEK